LETVDSVFKRIGQGRKANLEENDTIQIPKLDFDVLREYQEIIGRGVLNKGLTDYYISKAIQSIRFKLNEKGALLKSEAAMAMIGMSMETKRPKCLVFNQPFLLCLKEKTGKYPYFVMWVDNAELLLQESR
jgi:serine protease inhibitor